MAEKWDKQLMEFLKRTGDELKRTTDDLRGEAQRLLKEVKDPQNQAKVKEGLEQLRTWTATATKVATEKIETAVRQVEGAVEKAFKPEEGSSQGGQQAQGKASPPSATAQPAAAPTGAAPAAPAGSGAPAAKKAGGKSIGRKKAAAKAPASRPGAGGKTAKKAASGSKKTIGRAKKPTAGA